MKTIQMTLDEDLVRAVDRAAKKLKTNRSAFTRDALRAALARQEIALEEARHRRGYERNPIEKDEFSGWESEQVWAD